jgi:hypothetical protein
MRIRNKWGQLLLAAAAFGVVAVGCADSPQMIDDMPVNDMEVYSFVESARAQATGGDVEGAMQVLRSAFGKWPQYDAEIHFAMGNCLYTWASEDSILFSRIVPVRVIRRILLELSLRLPRCVT